MLRSSRGIFVTRNWDFENTFREVALIFQQENAIFYCNRERKWAFMYVSNLFFTSLLIYCLVSYFKCILIRFIVFSQFCVVNFFSQFIYTIDNKDKVMKYQIKYSNYLYSSEQIDFK